MSLVLAIAILCSPASASVVIMFVFYLFYVIVACFAVYLEARHRKLGPIRARHALVFAAVWGTIDFLLPVLPFLGVVEIRQVGFLTRLLDVIFYLPSMVYAMKRYDELDMSRQGFHEE